MVPMPNSNSQRGVNGASNGSGAMPSAKSSVQKYLTNCKSLYSCIYCRTHLANHDELVSRSFQGNHGRAYLFNSVINISCGQAVQRELNTGSHAVADIFCGNCETTLGWKYEKAYVETQKYKEGKYIIELAHVVRENRHLELDKGEIFLSSTGHANAGSGNNSKRRIYRNSLAPFSPSESYSPTGSPNDESHIVDDYKDDNCEDEELMFPFYYDLCSSRSSYPSSLSSSHHNRMRRSLYLDSTPYDWKYSATTSSSSSSSSPPSSLSSAKAAALVSSTGQSKKRATSVLAPSSLGSSSKLSSPTTSSSSSYEASPEQRQQQQSCRRRTSDSNDTYNNSGNSNNNNDNRRSRERCTKRANNTDDEDYGETQFEFEADKPESTLCQNQRQWCGQSEQSKLLDEKESNIMNAAAEVRSLSERSSRNTGNLNSENSTAATANSTKNAGSQDNQQSPSDSAELQPSQPIAASVSNVDTLSQFNTNSNSSISLDDEEFYDCYTDHDVSKMMIASDPTSTLKVAE